MLTEIIMIILGFIFLVKGADLLVKSATSIAKKFGLSEILIGLTIVALGTSLPEVFITITSAIDGHSDLIIGNAIGSCICNFLFVIGLSSLIQTITRGQGVVLLLCTLAYILYTIYEEKKAKDKEFDEKMIKDVKSKENSSITRIIIYMVLGILGLKFGSDFVVDNAIIIAENFGLSERFIGMTIVAIGTALPEIITGIISAKRGEADLLLGNITGSNILNLCLLIGLGAVINPLTFATDFNGSLLILIFVTIFLQIITTINKRNELDRKSGVLLILVYAIYICSMI